MLKDLAIRYMNAAERNDAAEKHRLFAEAINEAKELLSKAIGEVPAVFAPVIAAAMINHVTDLVEEYGLPLRELYEFAYLSNNVDAETLTEAVRIGNELI